MSDWKEKLDGNHYEETGLFLVSGGEWNVKEDSLIQFIETEVIEKLIEESRHLHKISSHSNSADIAPLLRAKWLGKESHEPN